MNRFMKVKGHPKANGDAGFTLIELMVVVGIIAILAALAVPRFQKFSAKARQAEATTNLSHIYTLESTYNLDNDLWYTGGAISVATRTTAISCQNANLLGFLPANCTKIRYVYSAGAPVLPAVGYTATGTEILHSVTAVSTCTTFDTWTGNDQNQNINAPNGVNLCN